MKNTTIRSHRFAGKDRASRKSSTKKSYPLSDLHAKNRINNGAHFMRKQNGVPTEFFGFTEDKKHRPNETRIAFWADTQEEVDRDGGVVRSAGGRNLEGPQIWPEYTAGYYALFFEDPDGNKLEDLLPAKCDSRRNEFGATNCQTRKQNKFPQICRGPRRIRFLKLIAIFKISAGRSSAGGWFFSFLFEQPDGLVGPDLGLGRRGIAAAPQPHRFIPAQ